MAGPPEVSQEHLSTFTPVLGVKNSARALGPAEHGIEGSAHWEDRLGGVTPRLPV